MSFEYTGNQWVEERTEKEIIRWSKSKQFAAKVNSHGFYYTIDFGKSWKPYDINEQTLKLIHKEWKFE